MVKESGIIFEVLKLTKQIAEIFFEYLGLTSLILVTDKSLKYQTVFELSKLTKQIDQIFFGYLGLSTLMLVTYNFKFVFQDFEKEFQMQKLVLIQFNMVRASYLSKNILYCTKFDCLNNETAFYTLRIATNELLRSMKCTFEFGDFDICHTLCMFPNFVQEYFCCIYPY